ncbi:MAG: holo-ACP synthase [Holosporales bacterium]|jgi:holo-[acyl-carrier protein] synthase|nr:holo-ACP synthase [Holosporales bacterium]
MIIGIGIDILDIRRVEKLFVKFSERFENKIFTKDEIKFAQKHSKYIEALAKIFSLKESVIKAISDVSGVAWHDIEILHETPKPTVKLSGLAIKKILAKSPNFNIHASVSDDPPYVTSLIIIESL